MFVRLREGVREERDWVDVLFVRGMREEGNCEVGFFGFQLD